MLIRINPEDDWHIENYPNIVSLNLNNKNIDNIFFDLNCAIHPCCKNKTNENMENHINHYRLTSKERLLAEAKMHFQLFIWSSAYYALAEKGKKREGYAFGSLYSAQQESGISFVSEGEALRGGL